METKIKLTWQHRASHMAVNVVLAMIFIFSAYLKFANHETVVNNFNKWQLTDIKNYIALGELLIALFILFEKTRLLGYILITIILCSAIYIHLKHDEPFYFPLAIIAVSWIHYYFIQPKKTL